MSFSDLKSLIINNELCCGCGVCSAVCSKSALRMVENKWGEIIPDDAGKCRSNCDSCRKVCPFVDENDNEDKIGLALFGKEKGAIHRATMGWMQETFVGRISNLKERIKAPSGGMTTAVLNSLMQHREIDAAIVVRSLYNRPWFQSRIASIPEEIVSSRGSAYHTVPLADTLRSIIRGPDLRYAVVALPCAAKAIRLAQNRVPKLKIRIKFVLGLTCGGQRNLCFTELMVALLGSCKGPLKFRSKENASYNNDFSMKMDRGNRQIKFRGLFGFLWLNGVGELKSCLYCDDTFAELADASFMDAWLQEFADDPTGMNLVISRTAHLTHVIDRIFAEGLCEVQRIAPGKVEFSQGGVIEKKHNKLSGRIRVASGWVPRKRSAMTGDPCSVKNEKEAAQTLKSWEALRRIAAYYVPYLRNRSGFFIRVAAWLVCVRLYIKMRRTRPVIYNSRAVFFMQGFRPRTMVRNFFARFHLSFKS